MLLQTDSFLIANWRSVLKRAWSIRLLLLAGILSGLEVALPLVGPSLPFSPEARAATLFIVVAAAFVARLLAQRDGPGDA